MTREIAHFQMFEAALETIEPNFPMGVLQGDPRYGNNYFNLSTGASARGPWNQGENRLGEEWQYVEDPIDHVRESGGMLDHEPTGTPMSMEDMKKKNQELSKKKSEEAKRELESPKKVDEEK